MRTYLSQKSAPVNFSLYGELTRHPLRWLFKWSRLESEPDNEAVTSFDFIDASYPFAWIHIENVEFGWFISNLMQRDDTISACYAFQKGVTLLVVY